jgi:hypothetical protein
MRRNSRGTALSAWPRGLKVEADPEAWTIWNGKLYVFGTKDSVPEFLANPGAIVDKANAAWESVK